MVTRIMVICLCLAVWSVVSGCAVGASPSMSGTLAPYWTLSLPEPSQGPDYEREINKVVVQYHHTSWQHP